MMIILEVDYPNKDKRIPAVYSDGIIYIKKSVKNKKELIFHEYVHYIIDKIGLLPCFKHYINLTWEITWVLLNPSYKKKKWSIKWALDRYSNARKKNLWVY